MVSNVLDKFWKIYSPRFSKNFCRFALNEPPPPNFRGDLEISDSNNWGDLSKKLNLEGAKFKGGPKILAGGYEPQWYYG